jgi:hypothetical protein
MPQEEAIKYIDSEADILKSAEDKVSKGVQFNDLTEDERIVYKREIIDPRVREQEAAGLGATVKDDVADTKPIEGETKKEFNEKYRKNFARSVFLSTNKKKKNLSDRLSKVQKGNDRGQYGVLNRELDELMKSDKSIIDNGLQITKKLDEMDAFVKDREAGVDTAARPESTTQTDVLPGVEDVVRKGLQSKKSQKQIFEENFTKLGTGLGLTKTKFRQEISNAAKQQKQEESDARGVEIQREAERFDAKDADKKPVKGTVEQADQRLLKSNHKNV